MEKYSRKRNFSHFVQVSLFATIITQGRRNGANGSSFGGNGERGDLAGSANGGMAVAMEMEEMELMQTEGMAELV